MTNAKTKYIVAVVIAVILVGTLARVFDDPFHEKTEKVCFWEWLGKEIWKLIQGEKKG